MVMGELRGVLTKRVSDPRTITPGFGRGSFACGSRGCHSRGGVGQLAPTKHVDADNRLRAGDRWHPEHRASCC